MWVAYSVNIESFMTAVMRFKWRRNGRGETSPWRKGWRRIGRGETAAAKRPRGERAGGESAAAKRLRRNVPSPSR
jgi:hypothetical protein